nr:MAG TPA: hypothetical protein [Bacteriophage sp.]
MDKVIVVRDFNGSDATLFGFQPRGKVLDSKDIDTSYLEFLIQIEFVKAYDGQPLPDEQDETQNDDTQTFTNEGSADVAQADEEQPATQGDDSGITNEYAPVEDDEVIAALNKATNKQELKDAVASIEGLADEVKWNTSIAQIREDLIAAYKAKKA